MMYNHIDRIKARWDHKTSPESPRVTPNVSAGTPGRKWGEGGAAFRVLRLFLTSWRPHLGAWTPTAQTQGGGDHLDDLTSWRGRFHTLNVLSTEVEVVPSAAGSILLDLRNPRCSHCILETLIHGDGKSAMPYLSGKLDCNAVGSWLI